MNSKNLRVASLILLLMTGGFLILSVLLESGTNSRGGVGPFGYLFMIAGIAWLAVGITGLVVRRREKAEEKREAVKTGD